MPRFLASTAARLSDERLATAFTAARFFALFVTAGGDAFFFACFACFALGGVLTCAGGTREDVGESRRCENEESNRFEHPLLSFARRRKTDGPRKTDEPTVRFGGTHRCLLGFRRRGGLFLGLRALCARGVGAGEATAGVRPVRWSGFSVSWNERFNCLFAGRERRTGDAPA